MRVYLPMTLSAAASALRAGTVPAAGAHAVTPALRERYATDELEDLELAALTDAAQVSLSLLAAEREARGDGVPAGALSWRALRLVLAADAAVEAPAEQAAPDHGEVEDAQEDSARLERPVPGRATRCSAVRLAADVPWSAVASAHVDEPDAEPDVAAAVAALLAAGTSGTPAAVPAGEVLEALEDAEACDLLWYAPSEVAGLLEDLSGA